LPLPASIAVRIDAIDEAKASQTADSLANVARAQAEVRSGRVDVLGPAEAPIAVVRGRHRFRLLVKALRGFDLSAYLREWLAKAPKPKGNVRLEVDVDPMSFL